MEVKEPPIKPRAKSTRKKKSPAKPESQIGPVLVLIGCGLFMFLLGLFEGVIFKSGATYGSGANSVSFDPITGVLFMIGGVFMIGFAIWLAFHPNKK